jgi:glycosyltransferase involved in cell wall biosynthesis
MADDPLIYDLLPRQFHIVQNARLLSALAKECDVIHLQKCFAATSLPILWICRTFRKPLHYDWDDDETAISRIVERRWLSRLQLTVYEYELPNFASTITYSSRAIRDRAAALGFPESRMWHLPVGADLERFRPGIGGAKELIELGLDPNKLTILYIGQMEGAAYAHQLMEAAPMVLSACPNCQFLLVGGGEQLKNLRRRAELSPVRETLHIPGYIESDHIPRIIGASDICVACFDDSHAVRAKSPLKIAEYLAAGKPIVASRVGEAPWMLDGCGITVDAGIPQALAKGILAYATNEEKRDQDGRAARERAKKYFTWERGTEQLMEAYRSCRVESG